MAKKEGYVYILASRPYGTLYTGVNSDLSGRVFKHKIHLYKGFTEKYNVRRLVWYEQWPDISEAIYREKQLKKWKRQWKIQLIERKNPNWIDLYEGLF